MNTVPRWQPIVLIGSGTLVGFIAWPGTTWGGALSVLLPFSCGLQSRRFNAIALSFGYYIGSLGTYAAAGFLSTDGAEAWSKLAETTLIVTLSPIAWGLAAGEFQSEVRRFSALLGAWFTTLLTPLGGLGLVHPSLGWIFIGKGGMGILTFFVSGLLTSILITVIWVERRQKRPWNATSAKSLSIAICTTLILGGYFDQTATPRYLGPVLVLPSDWGFAKTKHADLHKHWDQKLEVVVDKLEALNSVHTPIRVVVASQNFLPAGTAAERNATFQRLQHAVQRHGVGLVLVFSVNAQVHPWFIAPQDCIALLPSSFSMTTSIQGRSCKDDVSSERPVAVLSSREHVAPPLALEILQGNRQQIYPILLLQSVAHLSNTSGQTMVLSSLESSALMRSRTRVMTKHLNAVSWSARVSFLTAVNTQY